MAPSDRPGLALRAGPLGFRFDRGQLRWVELEGREVLRGIYPAVRGPGWHTVPPRISALRLEIQPDSFRATYDARHEDGPIRFAWSARLEGTADGTIRFEMDGAAETRFLKNRIGLCVLHPLVGCAGGPVEVEHGDGHVVSAVFPDEISPHQPFVDVRVLRHPVASGRALQVRLEGDWFEMEDQRNWSDTSFKTYSTRLSMPFPAWMEAGERVRQVVTVSLVEGKGGGEAIPKPAPRVTSGGIGRLAVGLDVSDLREPPAPETVERLRALKPDHLSVSLEPGGPWGETLARAADLARSCDARLEVSARVADERALQSLAEATRGLPVAAFLVFRADSGRSDPALLAAARAALGPTAPGARVGGGTTGWFADLNRNREAAVGAQAVAFALCPQVHARDASTILENVDSLADVARTAARFAPEAELRLSSVSLGPRTEPVDERLGSDLGGEWMARLLRSAEDAGFASLSLTPALGRGGLLDGDGPAYRALRDRRG